MSGILVEGRDHLGKQTSPQAATKTKVKERHKVLKCEMCKVWYHCTCENAKTEHYNILKNKGEKHHERVL